MNMSEEELEFLKEILEEDFVEFLPELEEFESEERRD